MTLTERLTAALTPKVMAKLRSIFESNPTHVWMSSDQHNETMRRCFEEFGAVLIAALLPVVEEPQRTYTNEDIVSLYGPDWKLCACGKWAILARRQMCDDCIVATPPAQDAMPTQGRCSCGHWDNEHGDAMAGACCHEKCRCSAFIHSGWLSVPMDAYRELQQAALTPAEGPTPAPGDSKEPSR